MKKIFTIIATALMAVSANADNQVIASWNAGETNGGTWTALGTAVIEGYTSKYNANTTSTTCMTFPNSYSKADDSTPTNCVKVEGTFKKGDVVTIQPFTVMSNKDFTGDSKYANIEVRNAANEALFNTNGTAAEKAVTDGHEEEGDPKTFYFTLDSDLNAIYFGRSGNTRINILSIVITRAEGSGEEPGGEEPGGEEPADETITWTFNELEEGMLASDVTYQTLVDDLMFTGGATSGFNVLALEEDVSGTFSDGTPWKATKYVNLPSNTGNWVNAFSTLRKAGVAGDASNSTFRRALAYNATKKGTFYVAFGAASDDETAVFEIYTSYNDGTSNTYATANAAYATGPVEVKLASTTDAATFWVRGSKNGTRIYAVRFVPEGAVTDITTVAPKSAKTNGKWYNLQGQEVQVPTKGIFIKDGKKVVIE